jgi:hypothetical protein
MSSVGLWQGIMTAIWQILPSSAVATVLAFGLFRLLGRKWIEGKFAERLEAYKHAQNKELEDVRFKINSIFNRLVKLHDKEFEVLPVAWGNLNEARQAILGCMSGFRQDPDLDALSSEELEEFLSWRERLTEADKTRIRQSAKKLDEYIKINRWVQIGVAREAFSEFHSHIVKNRIFLDQKIREKFDRADNVMWKIWVSRRIGEQYGGMDAVLQNFSDNKGEIETLLKQIEEILQSRLHPAEPI